jgi:hypothetical protein
VLGLAPRLQMACWPDTITPLYHQLMQSLMQQAQTTQVGGGGLSHVDMSTHKKSGIACQDRNQLLETVVKITKANPTSSQGHT